MRNGFTLIEIMVVVAVIIVLTGVGAVSLNKFNGNQALDAQKEELMSDLRLARNMAKTNQLPYGVSGSLQYVEIEILNKILTVNSVSIDESGNTNVNDYSTKKNESTNTINSSFGFSVENGRLTNGNGVLVSSPVCLTLYLDSDSSDKKYVYIETSGLIYEKTTCN
jgi:prepilin-type N-terminal cleavage/methylation domain-containing protein